MEMLHRVELRSVASAVREAIFLNATAPFEFKNTT